MKVKYFMVMIILMLFLSIQNVNAVELSNIPLQLEITNLSENSSGVETDRFVFKMIAKDKDNPMPKNSENGEYTLVVTEAGTFNLGPIDFDVPGVYEYDVYQVKGENVTCEYDDSKYTLIVSVENSTDYSTLETYTTIIKDGDEEKHDSIYFKNNFRSNSDFELPNTSDINLYLYITIFLTLSLIIYINLKRKVRN